ncbi:MAG: hypothetical protein U0M15_05090 [Bacillota bacterium]|nr:hypothetical protein [Bacillota bacterium]
MELEKSVNVLEYYHHDDVCNRSGRHDAHDGVRDDDHDNRNHSAHEDAPDGAPFSSEGLRCRQTPE